MMKENCMRYEQPIRQVASLAIFLVDIWLTTGILGLLYAYFAENAQHPIAAVGQLLGVNTPFKTMAELSWFEGKGLDVVVNVVTVLMIYIPLAAGALLLCNEARLLVSKGRHGYAAYKEQQRPNTQPIELGTLIGVTVNNGGFFTSTTTTIQTDKGFYFVYGRTDTLQAGSAVRLEGDEIVVDHVQGNTQRYPQAKRT